MTKQEFYVSFINLMNIYLEALGLGWKAVLSNYSSDGDMVIMQDCPQKQVTGIFPFVGYNRFTYLDEPLELVVRNSLKLYLREDNITEAAFRDMGVLLPDLVVPTLINAKRNKGVLESIPHMLYGEGDLAIVLRIIYHSTNSLLEDLQLDLRVTDRILEKFKMDFDTLYQHSLMNPKNQRAIYAKPFGEEPEKREIYVMTTESFYWGSSSILYKDKIRELSDQLGGDMILIPNSINHCLVLSKANYTGKKWIQETLYNARQSGYGQRELDLSDYLYAYNRENDEIRKTSQRLRQKPKVNKNHCR